MLLIDKIKNLGSVGQGVFLRWLVGTGEGWWAGGLGEHIVASIVNITCLLT